MVRILALARRHAIALTLACVVPAAAAKVVPLPLGNYDVRYSSPSEVERVVAVGTHAPAPAVRTPASRERVAADLASRRDALGALQARVPGARARFSPVTAAPELVSGGVRPLSAASAASGIEIVRSFVRANRTLYGLDPAEVDALHFLGESVSPSGLRMVRVEQRIGDDPVFGSETRFILDRDGRVLRSLGALVPGAAAAADMASATIAPDEALVRTLEGVGIRVARQQMTVRTPEAGAPADRRVEIAVADGRIGGPVASERTWFPIAPGLLVPAWRQIVFTGGDADWYVYADARDGATLWRKNMRAYASTQEARFSVYVQADGVTPADSPAPQSPNTAAPGAGTQYPEIARTIVNMSTAQDLAASPDGWIPDGGTTTTGNNVDACVDRVGGTGEVNVCDIGTIDNNGRPVGNPDANTLNRDFLGNAVRDFNYAPAPVAGNPDAGDNPTGTTAVQTVFRRGAVTQLFYLSNWYHDKLFALGFDEAAGNFQNTNFSGMGAGGDRVQADAQDSSGTNNANFSTPPDGTSGRMQMYRFTGPTPDRDGDLDAEVVLHELTHGTSNRLMGDGSGLFWNPGAGMGEGWSDFYALSLLNNTNADDPDARYSSGGYATYKLGGLTDNYVYGIRRFPYSTDNSVNPMTWAEADDVTADYTGGMPISPLGFEFNGAMEVHNIGEIWALTLWEMRARIIGDPAGANGDVPTGNHTSLQLVTDAMKMTPANPSYTEARDAILDADCATNACANEDSIWGAFVDRGLGYGAVAPLEQAGAFNLGHMSVGTSFALPHLDVAATTVDDSLGNNNGTIDPGEPIRLTVQIENPWRAAAKNATGTSATLTTSTAGVVIVDGAATYGAVAAQGTANGDTYLFTVPTSALCGSALHFTVHLTSSLGSTDVDFAVRVGADAGDGAPITYTKTLNPVLAIPDNDPRGVFDTQTITDDFVISDLNFRVDSISHTFTGDLTVMLRAPNGYGTDLIWLREILFGGGDGDNFTNTLIDDESANDLNQSSSSDAPFTGDWQPAFNSAVWNLFGDPSIFPDAVGELSRLDGTSTQGVWTAHVSDNAQIDSGTLNAWSLIVTPKAFTCTAFAPAVALSATKTVSGTFDVGGTVTYTVTITNSGSATQPDNAGSEFTDVLPAGLTLVSASATSGTAVATVATNTVTWDGSLLLGGGAVTITITATVNAGTAGTTISNQGTTSFDADANGSNEASGVTDDPGTGAANDPTSFTVAAYPSLSASKTVTGSFTAGGAVTYTIVLSNAGPGAQPDNPGDELTDVLPAGLTLVSASATSGSALATVATNTVTWNGSLPAAGSVTITVQATIDAGTEGATLANQASFAYDSDGNGTNDATGVSDDPGTGAASDPTSFAVAGLSVVEIPALSDFGFAALGLALAALAVAALRRRRLA